MRRRWKSSTAADPRREAQSVSAPPIKLSELSKISSTTAWPTGLRPEEPLKITSVSESPRKREAAKAKFAEYLEAEVGNL